MVDDRPVTENELIEVCDAATRLSAEIEAAWDTWDTTARTIKDGEAFEHGTIRPLIQRRRFLGERATMLRARTLGGNRARARMARDLAGSLSTP